MGTVASPQPAQQVQKNPPTEIGSGVCIYIGPTVVGVIQTKTIYQGSKTTVLKRPEIIVALKQCPEIENLIVDVDTLFESLEQLKNKKSALSQSYQSVIER